MRSVEAKNFANLSSYHRNKDSINARRKIRRELNPERYRSIIRMRRQNFPAERMFYEARKRAKIQGIPFSIEKQDILLPEFCPVLGLRLDYTQGTKGRPLDNSPSLDKIIPALGYVKGNIATISWRANVLKHDATLEEVVAIAGYIRSRCQ